MQSIVFHTLRAASAGPMGALSGALLGALTGHLAFWLGVGLVMAFVWRRRPDDAPASGRGEALKVFLLLFLQKKKISLFFFEKKNQKTFALLR